jgi:hypothetical protein
MSLTLRPFTTIRMVVLFGIQQASGIYDSDLEEVCVDLQTWEPVPRRDFYAPSTLLDDSCFEDSAWEPVPRRDFYAPSTLLDDSCFEDSEFYLGPQVQAEPSFPFDLRRAPTNDLLPWTR